MSVKRSRLGVDRSGEAGRAVFLSYAREDTDAARRIAEALRAAGVEVWFDQSELRGGDSWDAKIRQQIKDCALFLPIISASTQARAEGYFRIEWRLADRRTEAIGKSKPFLLPVCIDDTREGDADVPDSFLAVQWTRLASGAALPAFTERVTRLLSGEVGTRASPSASVGGERPGPTAAPTPRRRWLAPALLALGGMGIVAIWRPWQTARSGAETPAVPLAPPSKTAAEVAQLRARLNPETWRKDDLETWTSALDRIIGEDDQNAEAWALRSIIHSLQVMRGYDGSTKPLEVGRAAANRARLLAPASALAELALGMHHAAMISRGGDMQAARPYLTRALPRIPPDPLTRYADLVTASNTFDYATAERVARAWLEHDPSARSPAYVLSVTYLQRRRYEDAVRWAQQAASDENISGIRAHVITSDAEFYLRGDLAAARARLDRIPASARSAHRVIYACWLLAMAEKRWDVALQELARNPESVFFETSYYGPKAFLAGLAHQSAGRPEAAQVQLSEAERVARELLASDTQNERLHAVLAATLAAAGRPAEARAELALVEPLARGRGRTMYAGALNVLLAHANAMLGQVEPMTYWLRELLSGPAMTPVTPASLRIDPRFANVIGKPEVEALLAEFAHLDAKVAAPARTEKSIAVLAFENRSSEKDSEYFSDGVSEELLNVLARVPGLKVVGRSSSFQFRGKREAPSEIGRKLNVAYIVEGSVQRSGNHARIIASLVRADTGQQIWSDGFDSELKDILGAQQNIARAIAEKLSVAFGATAPAKSVNPAAHRLVLQGRHFIALRWAGFDDAEKAFTAAAQVDPTFAAAHAGIAEVNMLHEVYIRANGRRPADDKFGRAKAAARLAMELDPTLAEPHATLGLLLFMERQWDEAERHFRETFRRNPNNGMAYHWHGLLLGVVGKIDGALDALARSVDLDPLGHTSFFTYGGYLVGVGRFQEALLAIDRGLPIATPTGTLPVYHAIRAVALQHLGRNDEAVAAARLVRWLPRGPAHTPHWWADGDAIYVLRRAGHARETEEYLNEVRQSAGPSSHLYGYALCSMERFDEGVPLLQQADPMCQTKLYIMPMFESLRGTPRFAELFAKMNSTREYRLAREIVAQLRKEPAAKK